MPTRPRALPSEAEAGDLLVGVHSGGVHIDRTMYGSVAGRRGDGGYVVPARAYPGPCGNGTRCADARALGLDAGVLAAAVRARTLP